MTKDYVNVFLVSCFITLSITSHVIAFKVVEIRGVDIIPSSATYMMCFVILDLISIINKKKIIYLLITIEAMANICMITVTTIVAYAPSPDYVLVSESYKDVFTPIIIMYVANTVGSLVAFILDYKLFSSLYYKFGFLISSLISSIVIILAYTTITDIMAFKFVYPEHYLNLTTVNVITNIIFLSVVTTIVTPFVGKLRRITL